MKTTRVIDLAERALFARRPLWLLGFLVVSALLLWQAVMLRPDASLQKMVPLGHQFVQNYLKYENQLRPLSNSIRIAVEAPDGDIYNARYLRLLKEITDEVFYVPGIDRGNLRSLTTANTLWIEASEDGLRSGLVVPANFSGTPEQVAGVRNSVLKAGLVGQLVANDHRSSMILAPVLEADPQTGQHIDYAVFSQRLEERVRERFEKEGVRVHIVGFAKLIGDLIEGARDIVLFFLVTVLLTTTLVYVYSRCWRSTAATVGCCLLAVIWHLGIMHLLGFGLDPYSMLVPFLTFAIGVSHAMQNVNTLASESLAGASRIDAARATFRQLFVPGTVALLCNVVGFSTMLMIDIGVIRELAVSSSVGVGVIIFTKMFLLPILMSYAGLSPAGLRKAVERDKGRHRPARFIASFARPGRAWVVVAVAAVIGGWGYAASRDLKIGDLDAGAPELRADSRYNRDSGWFTDHYATSADVFVVMVKTASGECGSYAVASLVSRLQWQMEETPGVQSTVSLFDVMKKAIVSNYGGNLKWATITRNRYISNAAHKNVPQAMYNNDCSMLPVMVYLNDHKAETLDRAVDAVRKFSAAHPAAQAQLLLAAGNSGVEAATNEVVRRAWWPMLAMVYAIVALLLLLEFRSLKVMLAVLVPLLISSVLCEAVMAKLGLGVKVATLPVITLGVGIGVDYGIYLYNRLQGFLAEGLNLEEAYYRTMRTTGLAVLFTGVTLAAGVLTWVGSNIKFQADMGLLLTFMFLWNMVGAVLLIPALAALMRREPAPIGG
ncbi:RND family transporter [Ramlibacter sp. WS9]|uniref:efflux RND transporter permease subunit n=1 Tax=Ramlibacter sp. WS9 TaxID=1882741 RepID=UPI0011433C0B|nr:efflux RND transporter permease subunit [Ramlibacter sp. WS9]ROZ68730.1 RND family transporter [Ramlibacter sp. WS9]